MKSFYNFIILIIAFFFIIIFSQKVLDIKHLVYNSLTEKFSNQEISKILDSQNKIKILSYLIFPIILLVKTIIIASILYIGSYFFSQKEIEYNKIWNITIKSEFIFLLVPVLKIIWFYFFQTNYNLKDIQYFYPFSALNIVGYKNLEPWFIYPFQTLNLIELAYWLILAYYIGKATETNMDKGLKIVASSYGSALLLWVVTIMFFTLNFS